MLDEKIKAFFNEQIPHFKHDRNTTVGASEVFRCIKEVCYSKTQPLLHKPPSGPQIRGHILEKHVFIPLIKTLFDEENCSYYGDEQKTFISPDSDKLSATPDAIIKKNKTNAKIFQQFFPEGEKGLLDFKTITPFIQDENLPKQEHIGQLIVQMGCTKIKHGGLFYLDASDFFRYLFFPVKWDSKIYSQAISRAEKVMAPGVSPLDFPSLGALQSPNACGFCNYSDICEKTIFGTILEDKPPLILEDEEDIIGMYIHLKENIKQKKYKFADLREKLISKAIENNVNAITNMKGMKIKLQTIERRGTLDYPKMISDYEIDSENYRKETTNYLKITVKG